MAILLINESMNQGARQKQACEVVGISSRTLQHWRQAGTQDQRQQVKKTPANKLSDQERAAILEVCNSEEFKSQAPNQIVPTLADRGLYMASES
ncbi:MAG: helix-turn-helix domain-containing protein, partial [Gammaproteobacteria bacterium]|nr:helix-turn-helix domain-containing protein [Gammaproteobacteria bacterium]